MKHKDGDKYAPYMDSQESRLTTVAYRPQVSRVYAQAATIQSMSLCGRRCGQFWRPPTSTDDVSVWAGRYGVPSTEYAQVNVGLPRWVRYFVKKVYVDGWVVACQRPGCRVFFLDGF